MDLDLDMDTGYGFGHVVMDMGLDMGLELKLDLDMNLDMGLDMETIKILNLICLNYIKTNSSSLLSELFSVVIFKNIFNLINSK